MCATDEEVPKPEDYLRTRCRGRCLTMLDGPSPRGVRSAPDSTNVRIRVIGAVTLKRRGGCRAALAVRVRAFLVSVRATPS